MPDTLAVAKFIIIIIISALGGRLAGHLLKYVVGDGPSLIFDPRGHSPSPEQCQRCFRHNDPDPEVAL